MRKFYTITSPEQFDAIHFVQGDTFEYDCLNCGSHVTIMRFDKRDISKYRRMFCRRCNIRYTRHSNDTSKIIEITDPKQFDNIKSRQMFKFNCKRCGDIVVMNEDYFRPNQREYWKEMLCGKCRRDIKRYEQTGFYTTEEVKTHKETPIEIKSVEELKSLKNRQSFFYYCSECGAKVEMPYGRWRPSSINRLKKYTSLLCGKCSFDLLGDRSNFGTDSYKSKFREKHGVDNPMKDPEFKENCFKSREDNHGSRNWTNPEKAAETFKANHNGMTCSEYQQTEEYRNECINNNQKLFGYDWYFQSDAFREKLVEKFGEDNLGYGSDIQKNSMRTDLKSFVKIENLQNASLSQLISMMRLYYPEKYGIKKYYLEGEIFDSFPELAFYIYNKDFGIPIIRNNSVCLTFKDRDGNDRSTIPDFIVNGRLVEIKGAHFFKPDGIMYCPFRKPEWSDERYEFECDVYRRKHLCGLSNGVIYLLDTSPYVQGCMNYVNLRYGNDFKNTCIKKDADFIGKGYSPYTMDKSKEYQDPIGRALGPYDINN